MLQVHCLFILCLVILLISELRLSEKNSDFLKKSQLDLLSA